MKAIIVSDLHIGSPYFLHKEFQKLLENIPDDLEIVLNGDIIDNLYSQLIPAHQKIVDLIEKLSYRQKVIWIRGNHDTGCFRTGFGKVHLRHLHVLEKRLMITHGDGFDDIMPRCKGFIKALTLLHDFTIRLGARPVHVAYYAKKWDFLYKVLRKNVMINAVNWAIKNGYEAVVCGHTHFAEDKVLEGIRYINTGTWTESPAFFLSVTDDDIALRRTGDSVELRRTRCHRSSPWETHAPSQ